jgi:hypothetical protein
VDLLAHGLQGMEGRQVVDPELAAKSFVDLVEGGLGLDDAGSAFPGEVGPDPMDEDGDAVA